MEVLSFNLSLVIFVQSWRLGFRYRWTRQPLPPRPLDRYSYPQL